MLIASTVTVRWDGVPGATGYAIVVNGKTVATTGAKARTSKVGLLPGPVDIVTVMDLPKKAKPQSITLVTRP